ncbi:MAG: hypothetical protein Q4A75_07530 [Peptostreptococcaceae bacterium]|nr:hypothetical protein [Peptostreptococcaceae bacterium]
MAFIERIRKNEIAAAVKIEDLKHNMDLSRIGEPTEKDFKRVEKYQQALKLLS